MALDVYFKDDIAQGIVAVTVAMLSASVAHGAVNIEYCRGVLDTNRAHALNYGIAWPRIAVDLRQTLNDAGRNDLLELVTRALPGA
jgi:hypothetical protein